MKKKIPVEIGASYELLIEDLSHDGLGIARLDGFLIFVKDGLPKEKVIAKVTHRKKNYAHAQTVEKLETTVDRTAPVCPLFEVCGGCQIQHMTDEAQLAFKKMQVIRHLKKFAHIEHPPVRDVIGMKAPWRYRNKTQVPFGQDETGEIVAGFYQSRSHDIIDMPNCFVQTEIADDIISAIKKLMSKLGIAPYHESQHEGVLRHVVIRVGFNTNELMVIFVTKTTDLPHEKALCQHLVERFPEIKSIVHNINPKVTNVIFGDTTHVIYGKPYIVDTLDGLSFLISARSFYQVNPMQTEVLYRLAVDYTQITTDDIVFDAYCGIGTITLFLARQAKHVYGVEIVPDAISDAKKNAALNHINNVHFEVGQSEVVIPRWMNEGVIPDVIVVDPPRKGCDMALLNAMINARPKRIVYVSCDSATLARDIQILEAGGYTLEVVQPVDMFPQTSHVECVALLSRKK
ncbi:MAG: 23S rRNA (uracil(1939)-C(5))-methyltransferase RlmD [Defluviitaleaceae bacterium]|nr:23S rRNA (uracil(1939)-C(5))-methyltransferase RlmD [Defluviitaleaceae bacterium]